MPAVNGSGIDDWRLAIESAERKGQRAERERTKRYAPCPMPFAQQTDHYQLVTRNPQLTGMKGNLHNSP